MKRLLSMLGLSSVTLVPSLALAAPAVADKADNAFMMICTALVLFMTLPGIALFYGGLLRGKNVLSMLTQVTVTFALVCVLWVLYGYSLAFSEGNAVFGGFETAMLKGIGIDSVTGSISQMIHVAFQASFACITVALVVGGFAERIRFSAVLIFAILWFTLSYLPIAHMVWGGGYLATDGALDFAGGTVVHINAASAGLIGAYLLGKRAGFGKEAFKPHNLPMVFTGASILYIGWFGFNAGSASAANGIAALAFLNTVVATAGAILSWTFAEWVHRRRGWGVDHRPGRRRCRPVGRRDVEEMAESGRHLRRVRRARGVRHCRLSADRRVHRFFPRRHRLCRRRDDGPSGVDPAAERRDYAGVVKRRRLYRLQDCGRDGGAESAGRAGARRAGCQQPRRERLQPIRLEAGQCAKD